MPEAYLYIIIKINHVTKTSAVEVKVITSLNYVKIKVSISVVVQKSILNLLITSIWGTLMNQKKIKLP